MSKHAPARTAPKAATLAEPNPAAESRPGDPSPVPTAASTPVAALPDQGEDPVVGAIVYHTPKSGGPAVRAEVIALEGHRRVNLQYEGDDDVAVNKRRVPFAYPPVPYSWCWTSSEQPESLPVAGEVVEYIEPYGKRRHAATVIRVGAGNKLDLKYHDNWRNNDFTHTGVGFGGSAATGSWAWPAPPAEEDVLAQETALQDERDRIAALPEAQRPANPLDSEGRPLNGPGSERRVGGRHGPFRPSARQLELERRLAEEKASRGNSPPTAKETDLEKQLETERGLQHGASEVDVELIDKLTADLAKERASRGTNPPTPHEQELLRALEEARSHDRYHTSQEAAHGPRAKDTPEGAHLDKHGKLVDAHGRPVSSKKVQVDE